MDRYGTIKKGIQKIPNLSGVYKFYDKSGNLIYIGKSINLRKRIYSYFTGIKIGKTKRLVDSIYRYSYEVHDTHLEAKIRECKLIKTLKPHFNAQYKNDNRYLYLEISEDEKDPIIKYSSIKKEKSIGPFRSRRILEETLDSLSNLYPIKYLGGICFEYNIFPKKMNAEERLETQKNLKKILEDRRFSDEFLQKLNEEMRKVAAELKFERAEFYKNLHDNISYIVKSLDIKNKFENRSLILKIKIEDSYKCFLIRGANIKNVYYIDKWGNKLVEDKKFSIVDDLLSIELNEDKSLVDFRDILYSEVISNTDNIIWLE